MLELTKIHDHPSVCPYLDGRTARMPLELPPARLDGRQLDELLEAGYRRSGWFYYRTACLGCQECRPLRVDVPRFTESRSMRRVLKRGDGHLRTVIGPPTCDQERTRLFNRHRQDRAMARGESETTSEDYASFLAVSSNPTIEISYWLAERLAAVAVADIGHMAISAVYCYFDPELDYLCLGTYSILTQLRMARQQQMRWLYLGMYVAENQHLNYKARFLPHERLESGSWRRYEVETEKS